VIWRLEQAIKARTFEDNASEQAWESGLQQSDPETRQVRGGIERFRIELDARKRELAAKVRDSVGSNADHDAAAAARDNVDRQLKHLERRERERLQTFYSGGESARSLYKSGFSSIAETMTLLRPGEAYVGYIWAGESLVRTMLPWYGPESMTVRPFDRTMMAWLEQAAAGVRGLVGPDPTETTQDDLDAHVKSSLLGDLPPGVDPLIISPDGPLVGIPWPQIAESSAAIDSERDTQYAISIVPAPGTLRLLRATNRQSRRGLYLGVACDPGDLPLSEITVSRIAQDYFSDDYENGFVPTRECSTLPRRTDHVQLLHFACHAERFGLRLSVEDRWTTPIDLSEFGLRADMLLLTTCHTGDMKGHDGYRPLGNEFVGVLQGLLLATHAAADREQRLCP
jgi:hypothetical protein